MSTQLTRSRNAGLIPFFILTYVITWGIGIFVILFPAQFKAIFGEITGFNPIAILAVAAPTISATILVLVREGWSGVRALYARLFHWRVGIQWYALILIGIPMIGWLIVQGTGSDPKYDLSTPPLILSALLNLLIFGPLGEELGWRGYALPRLLKYFNPLAASLILGAIWGVWHLPSFFISSLVQSSLSLPIFLIMGLTTSILLTWLFEHTGRSVLIAVLFHYSLNFTLSIIGAPLPAVAIVFLVLAIVVVAYDKKFQWFRKVQPGASELHQIPLTTA